MWSIMGVPLCLLLLLILQIFAGNTSAIPLEPSSTTSNSSKSVQFSCGRTCPLGEDCIRQNGVQGCADPCEHYTVLDDDWRSTNNPSSQGKNCDRDVKWQGWYRLFLGQASAQIPDRCVAEKRCGTRYPMWMNGEHPTQAELIVRRTACSNRYGSCCRYSSRKNIHVKLCYGSYYIYKLVKPSECDLAYCAEMSTIGPVISSTTPTATAVTATTTTTDNSTGVEGQVRLANGGNSPCSGRVEIFHRGQWGTVCDDGWKRRSADVVCRQMGCGSARSALSSAYYGQGSGPIWLGELNCSGNEQSITDCRHQGFGVHNCDHGEDASVICEVQPEITVSPTTAEPQTVITETTTEDNHETTAEEQTTVHETTVQTTTAVTLATTSSILSVQPEMNSTASPTTAEEPTDVTAAVTAQTSNVFTPTTTDVTETTDHSTASPTTAEEPTDVTAAITTTTATTAKTDNSTGVEDPIQPSRLVCGADKLQIGLDLASLTSSGLNPFSGNLAAHNCSRARVRDNVVWYEVEAVEGVCGNTLKTNSTHAIYSNTLFIYPMTNESFSLPESVPFSCAYPLDTDASLNVAIQPFLELKGGISGSGSKARAAMSLFRNSNYTETYPAGRVTLPVGSPLYVGVSVAGEDPSFAVVLEDCYATHSSNPDDPMRYPFIQNKCSTDRRQVSVTESGSSLRARFSALFFLLQEEYQEVFLHCGLSLCDQRRASCVPSCSSRMHRSVSSSDPVMPLSIGPIVWDKSTE